MARLSPKIEIINHYDNLIHRVDIEIEKCLEKCHENQLLSEWKRYVRRCKMVLQSFQKFDQYKYYTVDLWSESTKVVDYLSQVRMRTIEELRIAQKDTLEYYQRNSSKFQEQLKDETTNIDELKSQLFAEKFYFQVLYKPSYWDKWIFNLFTICVDFYMSPDDIDLLEYLQFDSY